MPQSALNPIEYHSISPNCAFPLGLEVRLIYALLRLLCSGDAENENQPDFHPLEHAHAGRTKLGGIAHTAIPPKLSSPEQT